MAVVGIVSEFDPFHNGHKHLVDTAKAITGAEIAVTVMSGSFVQRGMPSMLSKPAKTECALRGGVDIVFELPVTFALSSAERFAFGAVSILNACGVVTHIAFGSECGDTDLLRRAANAVTAPSVVSEIKGMMKSGTSFAAARRIASGKLLGQDAAVLDNPNDILGVEYIKALNKLNSPIIPMAVKRVGSAHGSDVTCENIASASHIRQLVKNGEDVSAYVPASTLEILRCEAKNGNLRFADDRALMLQLRRLTADDFAALPEVREGLENRLATAAASSTSFDEFVASVTCRRYTAASVRRIAMCALLEITADSLPESPEYVRILGAEEKGLPMLHGMKEKCRLPIITKPADSVELIKTEIRAADMAAVFAKRIGESGEEFTKTPIFTKYLTESENKS